MTEQNSTRDERLFDGDRALNAYAAAQRGAVLFDRSHEGRLRLTGEDRVAWLQGLVTNDVAALTVGQGCEAAFLTPQGRMISSLRVLVLGRALWVDLPAMTTATVRERFDQFVITEDVTVEDITSSTARLAVHGGGASPVLVAVIQALAATPNEFPASSLRTTHDRLALQEHESSELSFRRDGDRIDVVLAGARRFGRPGFDLYVPAAAAQSVRERLLAAGAVEGDIATWDTLRVESGTPAFGIDMDETTIPLEAGLEDRSISHTKGCYVGQEVIVRVLHRGHGRVARRLVQLAAIPAGPTAHAAINRGATLHAGPEGREIGRITSAVYSPVMTTWIALGYVHRDFSAPGTHVEARQGEHRASLEVRAPASG